MDPSYAKKIGVDIENLLISQPDAGEQALEITDTLVRSGAVDVLVVDSVAALVPKAELEGEMGDSHMGLQARLMSQALRKLTSTVSRSNTLIIFINQIRMKIGVMFGNPETTTGGNALKFYASVRIDIRSIGKLKIRKISSAARPESKSSKTKWLLRSKSSTSTLCTAKVSPKPENYWISELKQTLSKNPAPGSPITEKNSAKAAKTPRFS